MEGCVSGSCRSRFRISCDALVEPRILVRQDAVTIMSCYLRLGLISSRVAQLEERQTFTNLFRNLNAARSRLAVGGLLFVVGLCKTQLHPPIASSRAHVCAFLASCLASWATKYRKAEICYWNATQRILQQIFVKERILISRASINSTATFPHLKGGQA